MQLLEPPAARAGLTTQHPRACRLGRAPRPQLHAKAAPAGQAQVVVAGKSTGKVPVASPAEEKPLLALLLEADSVLMDTHQQGHRQAFNRAFQDMGLKSGAWSTAMYHDLLRSGDGSPEGIIKNFFSMVGWPTSVKPEERPDFVRRVHAAKQAALKSLVREAAVPLRPGILEVVDAALAEGVRIGIIANTLSLPEESVITSALTHLGPERARTIQIFSAGKQVAKAEPKKGAGDSPPELPTEAPLNLEQQFAAAKAQRARTEALAFVRSVRGNTGQGGLPIGIDPAILANARRAAEAGVTPAWLAALPIALGSSAQTTALLAAAGSTLKAGLTAGMMTVAIPPTLATRGSFPSARVVFQGFGPGGGATWPRVKGLLHKGAPVRVR